MDKMILFPTLVLGAIFICFYLFRCCKGHRKYNLTVLVACVISSSGIVGGVLLILSALFEKIKILDGMELYIVIAGIAVLSVSLQSIHRDILKKQESKD